MNKRKLFCYSILASLALTVLLLFCRWTESITQETRLQKMKNNHVQKCNILTWECILSSSVASKNIFFPENFGDRCLSLYQQQRTGAGADWGWSRWRKGAALLLHTPLTHSLRSGLSTNQKAAIHPARDKIAPLQTNKSHHYLLQK